MVDLLAERLQCLLPLYYLANFALFTPVLHATGDQPVATQATLPILWPQGYVHNQEFDTV